MFTKKLPKSESSSKLLKILTKRSSEKRISVRRGIYDQWPTYQKPSLFNYSTNYLKYLNNCSSTDKQNAQNAKKKPSFSKKPATFSTCTTMEFFPLTQQNLNVHLSKFTSTPKSQQSVQQNQNEQKPKFTPYMSPEDSASQIREENDSSLQTFNEEESEGELNCKYQTRPQTCNHSRKTSNQERRLVKTAKLHRQKLEMQDYDRNMVQLSNTTKKQSISRPLTPTASNSRPLTAKNLVQAPPQEFVRQQIPTNKKPTTPTLRSTPSQEQSFQFTYNHPMRLKDYETNFQAYKVISELIDQQMQWEPKRKRPKSSVAFRKYVGLGSKV